MDASRPGEQWHILLIDDDEDDYFITRAMLSEMQGRRVELEWAATYAAGEAMLRAKMYHAVLVDYDLGKNSGVQLIRETVQRGYPAPLILYTSRGSYAIDNEAMAAGATLYLAKAEATPLLLERLLRYAIERKRIEDERDRNLQARVDILESIQDGFCAINPDWQITYINQRAAQANHTTPEELTGKNLWEAFPELEATINGKQFRQVMQTRQPVQFEAQELRNQRWNAISVYPSADGISIYYQDITQRRLAEQELRRSEEKFALIFQRAAFAATLSKLPAGVIVDVNQAWEEQFGYTREEALGKTTLELGINPDEAERQQILDQLAVRGSARNVEVRLRTKSGAWRTFSVNIDMVEIDGERYILNLAQDISERKQAEAALVENQSSLRESEATLHASEERLSRAGRAGQIGFYEWNVTTEQGYWTPEACEMLGYAAGTPPTFERWIAHVHPDDREQAVQNLQERFEKARDEALGRSFRLEFRVVHEDGRVRWLEGTSGVEQNGADIIFWGAVRDITERKEGEEALRNSEAKLRAVFRALAEGIVFLNPQGEVEEANDAVSRIHGHTLEDLVDPQLDPRYRMIRPDGSPFPVEEQPAIVALRSGEVVQDVEMGLCAPDGSVRWRLVNAQPVYDDRGSLLGAVASFFDITERKQAEQALLTYTEELHRSNQALEDFAFIASHDLQEPLRKVQVFGEMLKAHYSDRLENEGQDYIQRMRQAAGRMQEMLDGLLAYSRITTQVRPFTRVDLNQVTRQVLSDLEVRLEMSSGMVDVAALPEIQADALQMRQLLQNLISNALKFHRPGVPPQVKIAWHDEADGYIALTVSDNGIGFEEESVDYLFKPFHRLRGKSEFEGSGMGLAICHKIVERHGGIIRVHSTPGEGTCFEVVLKK